MNEKFMIGEAPDPVREVRNLLQYNDFVYEENDGRFTLWFEEKGKKWKTVIVCRQQYAVLYGIYPFAVSAGRKTAEFCESVNRKAVSGAMFTQEENGTVSLIFRTGAELFDSYSAYETIGRELEYNAAVLASFWEEASDCSAVSMVWGRQEAETDRTAAEGVN